MLTESPPAQIADSMRVRILGLHALPAVRRHRMEAGRERIRRAARRALRLLAREASGSSGSPTRTFQSATSTARSPTSPRTTNRSSARRPGAAARRARFRSSSKGLFFEGQPGVGKTHLAVAVLKQVVQTTGARGLFYDTRDLLRVIRSTYDAVDSHHRARDSPTGDDGRSARARRSRRGEDLGMGRRDDEPDRQHALQRAAADDLHVELRRHPRRHRSELAAVPHRPPHAIAAARDVRLRSARRRRLSADADQRRRRRPGDPVEDAQEGAARRSRPSGPRPAPRAGRPRRPRRPEMARGKGGIDKIGECSAFTSTSPSARPSATTAISIAACSTPTSRRATSTR